jgi:hypothetical protein
LLNYALAESKQLGLAALDRLLGAAVLAVSDKLDKVKTLSPSADTASTASSPCSKERLR